MKYQFVVKRIAFILFSVLVSACSNESEVSGQIFTEFDGATRKLSSVEVFVFDEEDAVKRLREFVPTLKPQCQAAAENVVRSKKQFNDASERVASRANLVNAAITLNNFNETFISSSYSARNQAATRDLVRSSSAAYDQEVADLRNYRADFVKASAQLRGIKTGANGALYSQAFASSPLLATMTDADGNFKVKVKSGKPYLIVAKKGDRHWFVSYEPKKGESSTIFLTDKNLNGTDCSDCFFNKERLKKQLSFIGDAVEACKPTVDGKEVPIGDTYPKWLFETKKIGGGNFLMLIDVCVAAVKLGVQRISVIPENCNQDSKQKLFEAAGEKFAYSSFVTYKFTEKESKYEHLMKFPGDQPKEVGGATQTASFQLINEGRIRVAEPKPGGCIWYDDYYFEGEKLFKEHVDVVGACSYNLQKSSNEEKRELPTQFGYSMK